MVAGRFAKAQALALRQITKNGETVTVTRKTRVAGANPGTVASSTTVSETCPAVFLPSKSGGSSEVKGTDRDQLTRTEEYVVMIPGTSLTFRPDPTRDKITRADGRTYEIVAVEPFDPNEDQVLFTLQVRK